MRMTWRRMTVLGAVALMGCQVGGGDFAVGPSGPLEPASRVVQSASGGYHFLVPADFNGGIFGGEVDNRFTFTAKRHADGSVSGHFTYWQYDASVDETYQLSGTVTCFQIYDTPVLVRTPEIPAMTQNRAKWGGMIEKSTSEEFFPVGSFAWAQSIDNGEGKKGYRDASTLVGVGDEAANEAFCNSDAVPNPNFGPHRIDGGNIQVRP